MVRIMTRFYYDIPVRTIWNDNERKWWVFAEDICAALTGSKNPKAYWAMLRRKHDLNDIIRKTKLPYEGKAEHFTDLISAKHVRKVTALIPAEGKGEFVSWMATIGKTFDDISKQKAYELLDCYGLEIGTTRGLRQIHKHIFDGLYDFAGDIRVIKLHGMAQIPSTYVSDNIDLIAAQSEESLYDIVNKYAMILNEQPFEKGSGRSVRIWLDMLLRNRYRLCVDWSRVDKKSYHNAMKRSPEDISSLFTLIRRAISDDVSSSLLFCKSVDYSYNLEGEEENEEKEDLWRELIGVPPFFC